MKTIVALLMASALFITACNNNKPKDSVTITSEDGTEQVTADANQMQKVAEEMEKTKDELGKLTPLTADELKAIFPAEVMGTAVSDVEVASAMGASTAEAKYKVNDSTDIKISIIDCAGPGGAGIYSMQYLGMMNIQQEDEDEYTKTIDFNGGKAFENCRKDRNECTLTYFSGGRLLISLEGDNVGINTLKDVAKTLKTK